MERKNRLEGMGALGLAQAHDLGPPPLPAPASGPLKHINSMPSVPTTKLTHPC